MRILVAPDSFKGSLSALHAAEAITEGIREADPTSTIHLLPAADGGEGTMESLVEATNGRFISRLVEGPLGHLIPARYGMLGDNATCVIELAEASGLMRLEDRAQNPLITSSFGTGQLLLHALNEGCRNFIIGLGGSATNDGGAGILQALGMRLLDSKGDEIPKGGAALQQLHVIDSFFFDPRIAESTFLIAADVTNPFIGPDGASSVFGPQKGASPTEVEILDRSLTNFADIIEQHTGISLHHTPGAGAAGGAGGAFQVFFPSTFKPGISVVLETLRFDEYLETADLVITGEGRSDSQTFSGKTPYGIAQAARLANVPVVLISGTITEESRAALGDLFDSVHAITSVSVTVADAMLNPFNLLKETAKQAILQVKNKSHSE
ncbi:glycerate kinase [Sporosarcina gallistercoris]|uniref:Glycerate kinase n=1 Tax=Sporosarcina gallistercoris TaxID=2762245 RepID=A0ABR8PHM2_9BACL|nr:glycerate kinase [Sporosarcina gallistercoris]MBD7907677.1 glycerate kinase [Sporosarcina gallistercoris]